MLMDVSICEDLRETSYGQLNWQEQRWEGRVQVCQGRVSFHLPVRLLSTNLCEEPPSSYTVDMELKRHNFGCHFAVLLHSSQWKETNSVVQT